MGASSVLDKSGTGSKCTLDGVTVLLELCMRFEQIGSVDSRDRIALRDLPECPRIIITVLGEISIISWSGDQVGKSMCLC